MRRRCGRELTPISVNWHVWPWCNYRCRFCFTTFKNVRMVLSRRVALRVPRLLARAGTEKISFAGGEPTLCPYLSDLLKESKRQGLTTMVISNGTGITEEFLDRTRGCLDWVALSVDSASSAVEKKLGRGNGNHIDVIMDAWDGLGAYGIRRKLNTVVTSLNWQEDMSPLIKELKPERWKVFQVLPLEGENEGQMGHLQITQEQFDFFVKRHADLGPIVENNDAMTGSYLMIDPMGRFFQNTRGQYKYSDSVFNAGVLGAITEVGWQPRKFKARGGVYGWHTTRPREGG